MAKKFPDLTGDGKVTQADVLKGRGVFVSGSEVDGYASLLNEFELSESKAKNEEELQQIKKRREAFIGDLESNAELQRAFDAKYKRVLIKDEDGSRRYYHVPREDMAMGGSLMMPPEREQASRGLKVLAKKLMAGAKKADKKLESKLDEMQGLDDTVIGVSSKTGRPKFATPGETAPEKGVIVGKNRVKIRDTSKTVKGGVYGTLGTASVAGLLELFDGNEAAMIS